MAKRRRRAFIVRAIFAAGIALSIFLAVIGTQPRNAARLKRTLLPILSVFSGQQAGTDQQISDLPLEDDGNV